MNVKELKEKLSQIPDDSAQIFCAEIIPFAVEETGETKLLIDPIKAYPVEEIAFSTKYDVGGKGKQKLVFGINPTNKIIDAGQTDIIELSSEQ